MVRERLRTGLAAVALGALVVVMMVLGAWYGLDRLGDGGLFGAPQAEPGSRVLVLENGVDGPAPGDPGTPAQAVDPAAPAADGAPDPGPLPPPVPDLPPPAAPEPGPDPVPAPEPVAPTIPDLPSPGTPGDTTGSVVRLAGATVDGLVSTVGDVADTTLGLLSAPAEGVQAAAVETGETADEPPGRAAAAAGAPSPSVRGPAPAAAAPADERPANAAAPADRRPAAAAAAGKRSAADATPRRGPNTPVPPRLPKPAR